MRHLCVDARLYHGSGIGTHLKAIISHLTEFELTLLVKEPLALPHRQIVMKSPIYSIREQLELPRKIPRCDAFWSPHYNIPLLPIRAQKRLVTIHDVYHLAHFQTFSLAKKVYAKVMYNAALRYSDVVMTDSQFSAEEIVKYCFTPKNMTCIPSAPVLTTQGKKVKNLPERYLLYVGNLKSHKNVKRLIVAHGQLKDAPPLVVVGRDFGEVDLPDTVCYLGYVADEELPSLYAGASLFVFPSTYEGFGIPPLEAMGYGCPALVGRVASLPEVCGDAAYYVDPFSVDSIKKGIAHLLDHPEMREELVKKGRERVKLYRPERAAEMFTEAVHACCDCP